MAKKSDGSKSQAIREVLTTNPKATAKDTMNLLAQHGIKINPGLFYFVKGKLKAGKQRRNKVAQAARAAVATHVNQDALTLIREIKALAAKSGGISKLKALVEALAE